MNTLTSQTGWNWAKRLLLTLPVVATMIAMVPAAQADQHHGFYRRHGYYRHHYRHSDHRRHYYYRHGHRYYSSYPSDSYAPRPGVAVHIGL